MCFCPGAPKHTEICQCGMSLMQLRGTIWLVCHVFLVNLFSSLFLSLFYASSHLIMCKLGAIISSGQADTECFFSEVSPGVIQQRLEHFKRPFLLQTLWQVGKAMITLTEAPNNQCHAPKAQAQSTKAANVSKHTLFIIIVSFFLPFFFLSSSSCIISSIWHFADNIHH